MSRPCPITRVYIADGFVSDCERLVQRCLQLPQVDFQSFSMIWKEMNFGLLYQGRGSGAEIAELSEEVVDIAKYYMVKDTSFFEENVTGLFLVYSLLSLQPFTGFAWLRLVPGDVRAVSRIELVARCERRVDVLYVLGEVLVKSTQYHADEHPRGMETVMRKYLDGYGGVKGKRGMRPVSVFYRQNDVLDQMRDLASLTRQYMFAKKAIYDGDPKCNPALNYIDQNLMPELLVSLRKLTSGAGDDEQAPNGSLRGEDEAENRSRTLQDIKFKAMSQVVDPMKHLVSAGESKQTQTSPRSKSDLKKPTGKIRTNNPVTISPKKWVVGRKFKRKAKGNLMEQDKEALNSHCDDDNGGEEGNGEPETSATQKVKPGEDIEIESLPLIFRTGNWDDIEIEIIDQATGTKTTTINKNTAITGDNIQIEIIDQTKGNEPTANENTSITQDDIEMEIIDQCKTNTSDENAKTTNIISYNEVDDEIVKGQPKDANKNKKKDHITKATNKRSTKGDEGDILTKNTQGVSIKNKRGQKTTKNTNKISSSEDEDEIVMIDKPNDSNSKSASSSEGDEPLSVICGTRTYKREIKEPTQDKLFPPKKKERRDLVRRDVKSRFKRLGMLSVANFEQ